MSSQRRSSPGKAVILRDLVREVVAEALKPLEERLAQLEAYVHQAPDEPIEEMDPVFVQFCNYRDKARAVTARQREEGQ